MTDLNQAVKDSEAILLQEQNQPITSRADIGASKLRRKELRTLLGEIQSVGNTLSSAIYNLPELPDERIMDWAESILSMRNLLILVLDTTGLDEDQHDIIRVYARSTDSVILDQLIKPTRVESANTPYTGIIWEELNDAPTLTEAWEEIIKPALSGQFVVSYGLPFIEKMLRGNIGHNGLSRLPYRGEDLMKQAKKFFNVEEYGHGSGLKLPDACLRIGHKIPSNPPLAADRAQGCLELLKATSNGVTSAPSKIDASTALTEIEDHPF